MNMFMLAGSISAALAGAFGAFGAHALKGRVEPALLEVYHTAVQYHFYHALGLFAVAMAAAHLPSEAAGTVKWAGLSMILGTVVFCGSLYVMSLSGQRWLGAITPLGGVAFITAWVLLAIAVARSA
jgi:uncharacterized membrane protein YgdD (TMEM256/DUF423 family)